MKFSARFAFFFIAICINVCCFSQSEVYSALEIGKACPDFVINNIEHFERGRKVSLNDFRGKYLILDFWTIGCTSCIESFSKLNALQDKFSNTLQFVLIGQDHLGKDRLNFAKPTYEKYRKKLGLKLPVVYDVNMFKKFNVPLVPYLIWIDRDGVVRAITTSREANEQNIRTFVSGGAIDFSDTTGYLSKVEALPPFNPDEPLLINNNGGRDDKFLFRSILAPWTKGTTMYSQPFINSTVTYPQGMTRNRIQMHGASLIELYNLAYGDTVSMKPARYSPDPRWREILARSAYGSYWIRPVLEMQDTSDFQSDWKTGHNLYSYSLIVPHEKATTLYLKETMQRDLFNYFNYNVAVEIRKMPCWFLESDSTAKIRLKTNGGKPIKINYPAQMILKNVPIYQLIRQIFEYNPTEPPIIDKTEIFDHIDLELTAVMMDLSEINKELKQHGLHLTKGEKEMKVIVIRECNKP